MDKSCEIIDLCVKSEKSDDTSTTIPFETNTNADKKLPTNAEHEICNTNDPSKKEYTEKWITEQNTIVYPPPVIVQPFETSSLENAIGSINNSDNRFYTERWITEQRTIVSPPHKPPSIESSCVQASALESHAQDAVGAIPTEITELVNKDCAIKLINHLVIYAFNKVTEADLHRKMISVTPDIDPQINYRSKIGFRCVYERCVVLLYEALVDLIEILRNLTPPHQEIVILWMYNTVENISKAHGVDSSFLRRERYIEVLLRDFSNCQSGVPDPGNIFFNICLKMQPTMVTAENQGSTMNAEGPQKKKRARRPRARNKNQQVV